MVRLTEAKRIEQGNAQAALGAFEAAVTELRDPRRRQGLRYPLRTVVTIALLSMICGCDDAESMEAWGEANATWLATFLEMPHGSPSQDVFLHVLSALDPKEFGKVFRSWVDFVSIRLGLEEKQIAIDGKTSRGSASPAEGRTAVHTISAWVSELGIVLGQTQTEEKSNEITAIPELLNVLSLKDTTVTIDAIGCQTGIAEQVVEKGGNYLIAAKENQPTLLAEIKETFAEADNLSIRSVDEAPRPSISTHEESDKGHGRIETRRVRVSSTLSWINSRDRWRGLGYVVEVTRTRTSMRTNQTSTEVAYYIGSGSAPFAERVGQLVRNHWRIENQLHWVLDMAFNEDSARHRAGSAAANMTILRHFALSVIKLDKKRKLGVANSRKRAGFNRAYLLELIRGTVGES